MDSILLPIINALLGNDMVVNLIQSLDPRITAGVIVLLTILFVISEVLVKLPLPYNSVWQVVGSIISACLKAFKRASGAPITPEKPDSLAARQLEVKKSGIEAADKMKQAIDEENKDRSDESLGQ